MDGDGGQEVPSGAKKISQTHHFCPPALARVDTRWTKVVGGQHFKKQKARIIGTFLGVGCSKYLYNNYKMNYNQDRF